MAKQPNWDAIRAEYLKGGISYRSLASKHRVNPSTLEKRAKRESWAEQLRQTSGMVAAELPAKVAEIVLTEASAWVAETLDIAGELRANLRDAIKRDRIQIVSTPFGPKEIPIPVLNTAQDIKALASALADIDKTARQALGLDKDKEDNATVPAELASIARAGGLEQPAFVPPPSGADGDPFQPDAL